MKPVSDDPEKDAEEPVKFVYHKLDPNIIRTVTLLFLAGMSEMKLEQISHRRDDAYQNYLLAKANVTGDLGGAKLAFTIIRVLQDIFVDVMKVERGRAKILIEMILSMALNSTYRFNDELKEGPKREPQMPE